MSNVEGRLRNQSAMLAAIAHDLRHALFRVGLTADLVRDERDGAARERSLSCIVETLSGLTRLADDLDDFSCLQDGRLRMHAAPTDPAGVAEATRRAFEPLAHARAITFSTSGTLVACVAGDHGRLIQALSNLVANAIGHTPSGGRVTIHLAPVGDSVRFTVSDTGPGIAAEELPHVFERYWRGGKALYPGRGLGLAITRGLVEQHGGTIWAENLAEGGAAFSFTIPCA